MEMVYLVNGAESGGGSGGGGGGGGGGSSGYPMVKAVVTDTKHLKNIYASHELTTASTCSKMEQVQNEGGRGDQRCCRCSAGRGVRDCVECRRSAWFYSLFLSLQIKHPSRSCL